MSDAYGEGWRARFNYYSDRVSCPYPPDSEEETDFYQGVADASKQIKREEEREVSKSMFRLFGC